MSDAFDVETAIIAATSVGREIGSNFPSLAADLAVTIRRSPTLEELKEAFKFGFGQTLAMIAADVRGRGGSEEQAATVCNAVREACQASMRGGVH